MPRLQALLSNAVLADLSPVRPFDSAPLWTSLVTGKRAWAHGVLTSHETDPAGTRIRPASSWALTARPVWSVLSAAGYRVQAFGWPATHPPEPVEGVIVSDQFADFGDETSIHPARLAETLRELRLEPLEIDAASLLTLVPRAGELNPLGDQRMYIVAQFLSSTASLHAAATWGLEHEPWDFAAVRYDGLVRLARVCGNGDVDAATDKQRESDQFFGDLLPNACRFYEMLLGRLLQLAGPDVSLMIIAATSPTSPRTTGSARSSTKSWKFIGAGPAFNPSTEVENGSVCDLAPTILAMFGLSPEPDTHGRAWRCASAPRAPSNDLLCGNKAPVHPPQVSRQEPDALPETDESVAHLLALGYVERPDEFLSIAIRQLNQERQWRLAESLIESGRFDRAAQTLESLVRLAPRSNLYRSALAEAHFHLGEYDACRRLILALQSEGLDTPLGRIALAAIDYVQGAGDPVPHLRVAETMGGASARMLEMMGRLYLGLRRRTDAARLLDKAIATEPALPIAHISRSIAYLSSGDASSAERHARLAAELNSNSYEARYQLGRALAEQNRVDDAIEALRAAVALNPDGDGAAHRRLADLHDRRGERAMAMHHRAISDRGRRVRRRSLLDVGWINESSWQ